MERRFFGFLPLDIEMPEPGRFLMQAMCIFSMRYCAWVNKCNPWAQPAGITVMLPAFPKYQVTELARARAMFCQFKNIDMNNWHCLVLNRTICSSRSVLSVLIGSTYTGSQAMVFHITFHGLHLQSDTWGHAYAEHVLPLTCTFMLTLLLTALCLRPQRNMQEWGECWPFVFIIIMYTEEFNLFVSLSQQGLFIY